MPAKQTTARKAPTGARSTAGVEIKVAHGIGVIWLAGAAVGNALEGTTVESLTHAFERLGRQKDIVAIVLAAQGERFCAGRATGKARMPSDASIHALLETVAGIAKPTIARVQGDAFGVGLGLVAACDIAIAATGVSFGVDGEHTVAVVDAIVRALGPRAASRYVLTGEHFDSSEAYRLGLLQELVPATELDGTLNALLGHLVQTNAADLVALKARLRRAP